MVEVRQTQEFSTWLHRLRDANAAARIVARIRRMEQGNPGDAKSVGGGILEMRIDYLDTEARQVAYIAAALESGDADFVRDALGLVARARGMAEIAKNAGLNRESLYKALGETGNPEFGTVMRIVRALGLTLSARPAATGQTSKRRRVA